MYFHIIIDSNGQGDISDSAITQQMQVLNNSYNGTTGGAASVFRFQFGGITRTVNAAWFRARPNSVEERAMKTALRVGGSRDLNFYTGKPRTPDNAGELLGYSSFPYEYTSNPVRDGVVVHYGSFPNGYFFPYNEGDTGTHEVGHWLGLFHTFQGGCFGVGDQVGDTPAEERPSEQCRFNDSCLDNQGPDPIENFMNYTPDSCMFKFTPGQVARARSSAELYRPNPVRPCRPIGSRNCARG